MNDLNQFMGKMQINKFEPTTPDVHFETGLTNLSVAYFQDPGKFVASQIFPHVPVQKQSDKYRIFTRSYFNRSEVQKRAPATESAGIGFTTSDDSYFCEKYSIHFDIIEEVLANQDPEFMLETVATRMLAQQMLLKQEIDWCSNFFQSGVWTDDTNSVNWSDAASEPIKDVANAQDAIEEETTFRPNTMVISAKVYTALKNHPDFLARVNQGQTPGGPAKATRQLMAELFEVDRFFVLSAVQNTAKEGIAESNSYIASDNALLLYVPDSPGLFVPASGYTFSWTGYNQQMGRMGTMIRSFPITHLDINKRIENTMFWDQKLVGADLGYMFPSVLTGGVAA